ncbi:molybdate ABC transporter substrate-binding protein [Paenibacillus hunanensis]|uniref:Molybdate transport system substrate-binding protein n=1 Tax=Paenibacillus hunanensis TaxID=539262 RepID=A0ABU1IUV2_9BACL|nr:molybdate transport system substrate-binding protein [Paenibacillus hunanensis]GGJ12502.1 molybdate ABC transporter substrate-binding protein [Paenibacillus hunanensis]
MNYSSSSSRTGGIVSRFTRPVMPMLILLMLTVLLSACSAGNPGSSGASSSTGNPSGNNQPVELTISAAASLTDSLKEIQALYAKKYPNVILTFNFGASGTLQKQIEQGAPADLFLSAGSKQMKALVDEKLISADRTVNLLTNELVLVVPKDSTTSITSIADLKGDSIKRLAIGTPESVPVGMYAKQVLEKSGEWDTLQPKLVQTKDVKQVLSYVETGNADAGFVYKTDALESQGVKIAFTASEDSHDPIVYPIGVLSSTTHREDAALFYAYLQTQEALDVFAKYGFNKAAAGS